MPRIASDKFGEAWNPSDAFLRRVLAAYGVPNPTKATVRTAFNRVTLAGYYEVQVRARRPQVVRLPRGYFLPTSCDFSPGTELLVFEEVTGGVGDMRIKSPGPVVVPGSIYFGDLSDHVRVVLRDWMYSIRKSSASQVLTTYYLTNRKTVGGPVTSYAYQETSGGAVLIMASPSAGFNMPGKRYESPIVINELAHADEQYININLAAARLNIGMRPDRAGSLEWIWVEDGEVLEEGVYLIPYAVPFYTEHLAKGIAGRRP